MTLKELEIKENTSINKKIKKIHAQFSTLIAELKDRKLSQNIEKLAKESINTINETALTGSSLFKLIKEKQTQLIKELEKEMKIVPKNYYRNLWMLLGMSGIGLPLGVAFGLSVGNIGLLGLGLPFGMAIGAGIGTSMDKKAQKEGRQLQVEIKI